MDAIIKMARSALGNAKDSKTILKTMGFKRADEVKIKSGSMVLMASTALKKLYLVCIDEYPLGWGMLANGTLKNKYLPGWRLMS